MTEEVIVTPPVSTDTPPATPKNQPAPVDAVPKWGDDWREKIAGQDEKMQKHLSRFNSIEDIAKSNLELREKISKGEYKRATEPPKDDEIALKEWRTENGVPESADKYSIPEGIIVGEDDKPILNEFLKSMHERNVPDSYTKPAVEWYFKLQEQQLAQEAEFDKAQKIETEETLRKEWGAEYRSNYAEVENFVKGRFSEPVANALLASSDTVIALAAMSREINPTITLFPNSQNAGQSLVDELKSIESKMHTDAYKKDPKMQQRYGELLAASMKMQKR